MNWTAIFFPVWILRPRFLLVLVFLVVGALLIAFNYSYSDGNRAGYIQKFSKRKKKSKWSPRNKEIAQTLIDKGLMTDWGLLAIKTARENGEWDKPDHRAELEDTEGFKKVLEFDPVLAELYAGFTDSLKRHYAGYYFDAKTEPTRKKRLEKITEYMKEKKRIL